VAVRALGAAGLAGLRQQVALPGGLSSTTLRALPGFWREAALFAVPSLAFPPGGGLVSATFAGLFAPAGHATGDGEEGSAGSAGP
jgi:hypothetical protein